MELFTVLNHIMHKYSTVLLLSRCKYVKLLDIYGRLFRAFPFGSRYPLYLFCLFRTKKDAAFIANAALEFPF